MSGEGRKRRTARFRITGRFDTAQLAGATVTIGRDDLLFSVRRFRSRTEFTLPLVTVAEIVVHKCVKATVAEERKARQGRRAWRR